jgi:hypothetical protein
MAYDRDVKDLPIAFPYFTFPGDEALGNDEYIGAMRNTYLRKLPFAAMLMEHFELPTSQADQERIKRGLVCMGWLDHMLDEAPDRNASLRAYNELVQALAGSEDSPHLPSWIRPEVWSSVTLLRNAIHELPQEAKTTVSRKAQRIGAISLEKANAENIADYCAALIEEGALSSDVVIECLGVHTQRTDSYQRLHTFNGHAMVAATLLDAAIDLKQDHKDGLTKVEPSLRNRLFLYRKAFGHLPYIVRNLGAKGLLTIIKVGAN